MAEEKHGTIKLAKLDSRQKTRFGDAPAKTEEVPVNPGIAVGTAGWTFDDNTRKWSVWACTMAGEIIHLGSAATEENAQALVDSWVAEYDITPPGGVIDGLSKEGTPREVSKR